MSAAPFVLVLTPPPREPTLELPLDRDLAGLTTPLRLALTAQSAGAMAVHLDPSLPSLRGVEASLRDPRLTIAVTTSPIDDSVARLEVAANVVVHRGLFAALRDAANAALATDDRAPRCHGDGDGRVRWIAAGSDRRSPEISVNFASAFGFAPIAVATSADASRAVTAMLRSLRKTADGWTSTYLNRHISLACTRLLVRTSIHPNRLSVGILFIGLASGIVASRGGYWALVVGALLLHTQSVLDGCDGELSRLTFRGSRLGEWLDTIGDDLSNYGFFAGASWGLYRATAWWPYLLVGGVIVGCGVVTSGLEYRYLASIGSGDLLQYPLGLDDEGGVPTSSIGKLVAAVRPLFKRDTFVFLTFLAALVGALGPMLVVFAAGGIGIVVAVVKAELRMADERARALRR